MKKIGQLFIRFLAAINALEGIFHLVFAVIGLWGSVATNTWDWRILSPIIENLVFGVLSIATGLVLGKGVLHHHHH